MGRGWSWILDTFPMFLLAASSGMLLAITYTSIGLVPPSSKQRVGSFQALVFWL